MGWLNRLWDALGTSPEDPVGVQKRTEEEREAEENARAVVWVTLEKEIRDLEVEYEAERQDWLDAYALKVNVLPRPKNTYRVRRDPVSRSFCVETWKVFTFERHFYSLERIKNNAWYYTRSIKGNADLEYYRTFLKEHIGRQPPDADPLVEWVLVGGAPPFPFYQDAVTYIRQLLGSPEVANIDDKSGLVISPA